MKIFSNIFIYFVILLLSIVQYVNCRKSSCNGTSYYDITFSCKGYQKYCEIKNETACDKKHKEIYKEFKLQTPELTRRYCCKMYTGAAKFTKADGRNCRITACLEAGQLDDSCISLNPRYINGVRLEYEEVTRQPCSHDGLEISGYTALCCRKTSQESWLATIFGAEPNEFPHLAKILPSGCSGTIYNRRFVITAAQCVIDHGDIMEPKNIKVILGTNIGDQGNPNYLYGVKNVFVHEDYVGVFRTYESQEISNVALLELDRDILFSSKVKALALEHDHFDQWLHGNKAVTVEWATSDKLVQTGHVQKTTIVLGEGFYHNFSNLGKNLDSQILCMCGHTHDKLSYVIGKGDLGGPTICRDKLGQAVLCGITSFWGENDICQENDGSGRCWAVGYVKTTEFRKWIHNIAGFQEDSILYKPYLDGKEVPWNMFPHQVQIISKFGKLCGGTLITRDIVVTAGQCVLGGWKLKVRTKDWKIFWVKEVRVLPGQGGSKNGIALLKLDREVHLHLKWLPRLPRRFSKFSRGTELAWSTNAEIRSLFYSRDFNILENNECTRRFARLRKVYKNLVFGENVTCGVEIFSGGTTCGRTLGGGLICKEGDVDVLCGIQNFRSCGLSIPSVFLDIAAHRRWILREIEKLKTNRMWRHSTATARNIYKKSLSLTRSKHFKMLVGVILVVTIFENMPVEMPE